MDSITIELIYQEILDGKRKYFPPYTWNEDVNFEISRLVTIYLIEYVLIWDQDALRQDWNQKLIQKMKLATVLSKYNSSPYAMLNDAFPNYIKEWELGNDTYEFLDKAESLRSLTVDN